jgi:hypothetical protein
VIAAAMFAAIAGAVATIAGASTPGRATSTAATVRPPPRLSETGLYSDPASHTVDPRNLHYTPQYPLWSDGAAKQRWIRLPPGTAISARDPEVWAFPVGTKLWKEFSWDRRVETRYLERTRGGWIYAAYVWDDAQGDAVLVPEGGVLASQEVAPGRRHRVPSRADCLSCHQGGRSEVLGFSALQLSPDRDPLAPHAEAPRPESVDLRALVARRLVRGLPAGMLEAPPRVVASTPRGRAAMGYLHANCGGCHDSVGPLASLGLALRHSLTAGQPADEPAAQAIGQASRARAPGAAAGESRWIAPGAPGRSTVVTRMASRHAVAQMPPLGTQVVDADAVKLLESWIEQDLSADPRRAQH